MLNRKVIAAVTLAGATVCATVAYAYESALTSLFNKVTAQSFTCNQMGRSATAAADWNNGYVELRDGAGNLIKSDGYIPFEHGKALAQRHCANGLIHR